MFSSTESLSPLIREPFALVDGARWSNSSTVAEKYKLLHFVICSHFFSPFVLCLFFDSIVWLFFCSWLVSHSLLRCLPVNLHHWFTRERRANENEWWINEGNIKDNLWSVVQLLEIFGLTTRKHWCEKKNYFHSFIHSSSCFLFCLFSLPSSVTELIALITASLAVTVTVAVTLPVNLSIHLSCFVPPHSTCQIISRTIILPLVFNYKWLTMSRETSLQHIAYLFTSHFFSHRRLLHPLRGFFFFHLFIITRERILPSREYSWETSFFLSFIVRIIDTLGGRDDDLTHLASCARCYWCSSIRWDATAAPTACEVLYRSHQCKHLQSKLLRPLQRLPLSSELWQLALT